jgi:wobble nucleotide-excising tRNase
MKIREIKTIKKYKCFKDFSWHKFFNNGAFNEGVNLLFGENGCGKTAICNILKSVSGIKDFWKHFPEETSLLIDNKNHTYENNTWNEKINEGSILFFDKEFVDKNVQLGHDRGTLQDEQEQASGKIIIEFDSEAINLRSIREKCKKVRDEAEEKFKKFSGDNKNVLEFFLTDEEIDFFQKFKNKTEKEIKEIIADLKKTKEKNERKLTTDQSLQKKSSKIQSDISEIGKKERLNLSLSIYNDYQSLFNFELKERAKIEAEQGLIDKIKIHKDFFESGFEIRKKHPEQCPFCQSKNEEENIKQIIQAYNQLYDSTYKKQYQQFIENKQVLVNELESIKEVIDDFNLSTVFLELKKLDQNYKIRNIYSVEEESKYKKPKTEKIKELKDKISNLKKPNKENIEKLYNVAKIEFEAVEKFFADLNKLITEKNKLIVKFKNDNTDEKLQIRIVENQSKIKEIEAKLDFLNSAKIEKQKKKQEKEKELKVLEKVFDNLKTKLKEDREKYEEYCSKEVFAKLLNKIETYFKSFNFNFKLKLDTERKTQSTKEFPFAFKILDQEDKERDFKEGLSEGEWQVLSLCFFFAFLGIQKDKDQKILIFDDPITSLDNSNLACLVDLISDEQKKFSQTFILTHHRTFFKFLRKKFGKKCNEYNILRNKKILGGSFICKSKPEKFIEKLKNIESHIQNIPPESLDIELKIVEYGQYLRYEVERFIKNDLLHWDKDFDFTKAIDGVKSNQNIAEADLEKIKQVYLFCNWTTSHVDVGDDHGLSQLKDKIKDFTDIVKS